MLQWRRKEARNIRKHKWLAWLAGIVLAAVLCMLALDQRLAIREYTVDARQVTGDIRLAVLTDYHGTSYQEEGAALAAQVAALNPDAVLLVGDMFSDWPDAFGETAQLMQALASRWPCYYVTGNHEYWTNRIGEILRITGEAGVTVLDRSAAVLTVRGEQIALCGVPDPYAMQYAGAPDTDAQLRQARAAAPEGLYTLLMAHRPELIGQYAAHGFDLVISGHAHGGQIRIPGLINGLYAPN